MGGCVHALLDPGTSTKAQLDKYAWKMMNLIFFSKVDIQGIPKHQHSIKMQQLQKPVTFRKICGDICIDFMLHNEL